MSRHVRAWVVTDEDESWTVVMHHHGLGARREGANELSLEFDEVICRRAPEFDHCSPHSPTDADKFEAGWWFECSYRGCAGRVFKQDGGVMRPDGFFCEEHADPYAWHAPREPGRFNRTRPYTWVLA